MLKTNELPVVMSSESWTWERLDKFDEFWLGEDPCGNRWLMKGRGSFYALREKSFSYLSQKLGISTQSSTYLILSNEDEAYFSGENVSKYQLATEYFEEHDCQPDGCFNCPIDRLNKILNWPEGKIKALQNLDIGGAIDLVKVDMLAYICGANESSGQLLTKDHRIVTIDNEQMFASSPNELTACDWFKDDYSEAMKLAVNLCEGVSNVSDAEILQYTSLPGGYQVDEGWSIQDIMVEARSYAARFLAEHA